MDFLNFETSKDICFHFKSGHMMEMFVDIMLITLLPNELSIFFNFIYDLFLILKGPIEVSFAHITNKFVSLQNPWVRSPDQLYSAVKVLYILII